MMPRIHGEIIFPQCISNKQKLPHADPKPEKLTSYGAWENGYSFKQFLGNCYAWLGDMAVIDGIQQLCHQYYLQNGSIGAKETAVRIIKFLNQSEDNIK